MTAGSGGSSSRSTSETATSGTGTDTGSITGASGASTSTGGTHTTATGETGTSTTGTSTGGVEGPTFCKISPEEWTFSDVALVANINSGGYEGDPVLTADGHVLFFARGDGELWRSSREGAGQPFSAPTSEQELGINNSGGASKISFSADELEVYLSSSRDGGLGGSDVWRMTRADTNSAFANPALVDDVNISAHDYDPHISPDGLRLYHAPAVAEHQEIVVSTRASDDLPFGAPSGIAELNSGTTDADPTLSADELVIVFSSHRTGIRDLYLATRTAIDEPFSTPQPLEALNSTEPDGNPFLASSPLGCELFFTSTRDGGPGGPDIYRVEITGS